MRDCVSSPPSRYVSMMEDQEKLRRDDHIGQAILLSLMSGSGQPYQVVRTETNTNIMDDDAVVYIVLTAGVLIDPPDTIVGVYSATVDEAGVLTVVNHRRRVPG